MINPVQPIDTSVPWGWNPAATFLTAFNTMQENKQNQAKAAMDMEMERILFPLKKQTMEMNLEKLIQDRDRTMLLNNQLREARRSVSTGMNSALSSNAAGGQQNFSRFSPSRYLSSPQQTGAQPSQKRILGSNLTPKTP